MSSSPRSSIANYILTIILFMLLLTSPSFCSSKKTTHKPCKTLTLYFHETLFNGTNPDAATSAIVAAPHGASLLSLADQFYFGDVVVFDDPVTLGADPESEVVGRAQGMYTYANKKTFAAWHSFSFFFNGTRHHRGTIQVMGLNPVLATARELSVVGGTGDFFMHRGIATFTSVAVEWRSYYMLRVAIEFYECW